MPPQPKDPTFFADAAELRGWLERHHDSAAELWVGLHKKKTGRPSVTWPELVDEVLCFGWIDGVRRSLGEEAYAIRITPHKPGGIWSNVNRRRADELIAQGRMRAPGRAAFDARDEVKSRLYSYERENVALREADEAELRANAAAWAFFEAQPPGYRRTAIAWINTAKREATRRRRLEALIRGSAAGLRIGPLRG